jgi:phospholipid transport system substrate-binding protein
MKKLILRLAVIALIIIPFTVYAGAPLDAMKTHINNILDVLGDKSLKGKSGDKTKKEKIRVISQDMFDFNELSRRTLARNWKKLNGTQQKEFTNLYRQILEDLYVDKIMTYTDEKVLFKKEDILTSKKAEIQTIIQTKKADIPIFYRVTNKSGAWRVYDVVIEGVSLISNYRTQFREILAKDSPAVLLDTLRKKVGKA